VVPLLEKNVRSKIKEHVKNAVVFEEKRKWLITNAREKTAELLGY